MYNACAYLFCESTLEQEPRNTQLLRLLEPVKHEWRNIGEQLCIANSDLQCIRQNVQSNERLSEILHLWKNRRKCEVSWKKIIDVIKNIPIQNVKVANEICQFLLDECNSGQQGTHLTH